MRLCVVGCERSGTSAVASLLHAGSGWSLLDDPPESWYIYPMVYRAGCGIPLCFWWKLRTHRLVKVPGFATILPELERSLVGRFVALYCLRDPRDVIASILERCEQGPGTLFTHVAWLGINVKDPIEALAWRWRKYLECAQSYLRQGGRVRFLKYEDFCQDKVGALKDVALDAGMPFEAAKILSEVDRQFRKGWSNTIAGPGRWRRDLTGQQAKVVTEVCKDWMEEWGYDT